MLHPEVAWLMQPLGFVHDFGATHPDETSGSYRDSRRFATDRSDVACLDCQVSLLASGRLLGRIFRIAGRQLHLLGQHHVGSSAMHVVRPCPPSIGIDGVARGKASLAVRRVQQRQGTVVGPDEAVCIKQATTAPLIGPSVY